MRYTHRCTHTLYWYPTMPTCDDWPTALRPLARATRATYLLPGLLIAVADSDGVRYLAEGDDGNGQGLDAATLFPVASISKLATALAVLRLVDRGRMELDDALALHVPEAAAAQPGVTLRSLLCHTAGLPYDLNRSLARYDMGLDWPTLREACLQTPLASAPGERMEYSNVGPGLLAIAVERMTGQAFPDALQDLVLAPLGVEGYLGAEPPRPVARVAGQFGNYAGTEREPFNSRFWRSVGFPWGGLVTTAAGALRLAQAFAGVGGFLPQALLQESTSDQVRGLPGTIVGMLNWQHAVWGLGPEVRGVAKDPCFAPPEASPESFGHAGASGCLVWCDPAAGVSWFIHGLRTFDAWWPAWPGLGAAVLAACGREG